MADMPARRYLDYAATAPLDRRVLEAMEPYLTEVFGNASTLYAEGKAAARAIEDARRSVARCLNVRNPHDIVFTSGGTESNNTAVRGIALAARDGMRKDAGPGHAICSSYEHKAVLEPVRALKAHGFETTFVAPRADGIVHPDDIAAAMRPDTVLVSVMAANNEIGTVNPVSAIADAVHAKGARLHVDAIAALGKIPVDIAAWKADAVSFTAHKICGPKGIGGLYLAPRMRVRPLVLGGGQEHERRSGTYDTASIIGFSKAVELACGPGLAEESARLAALRDALVARLCAPGGRVRTPVAIEPGDVERHLPNLVPLLVAGEESETLVMRLDSLGFAVSGGSACTSKTTRASHVLTSIGVSDSEAAGFLRISFGRFTQPEELDAFATALESLLA